jgi:hypothetical protein
MAKARGLTSGQGSRVRLLQHNMRFHLDLAVYGADASIERNSGSTSGGIDLGKTVIDWLHSQGGPP